ncbi:MAG: hypothetical protein JRJ87_25280, partial [Deltaproteobacteria bacterium]|nr:hypothetical protein [Deltaproteobacteria bacterium]
MRSLSIYALGLLFLASCGNSGTSNCTDNSDCEVEEYCGPLDTCVPRLADGSACTASLGGSDCQNNHCQNGFCCAAGDCCAESADCTTFDVASNCSQPSTCTGTRTDFTCSANKECVGTEVDDDSGCQGTVADDCAFFLDATCSDQVDQSTPVCDTSCETAGAADHDKCDSGYFCIEDGADFICQPPQGAGECCMDQAACPGVGCANGLSCGDEQTPAVSVCCVTGNICCTQDSDCQGVAAAYTCDQILYQCKTDCSIDAECQSGYFCKDGECAETIAVGEECDSGTDVCQAGLHCGAIAGADVSICCEEGKTCCRLGQHTECGFCEQCGVNNYCDYQLEVDYKDNCDDFDCALLIKGWSEGVCERYTTTGATTAGKCNGAGACYTLSESCSGAAEAAACLSVGCRQETMCVAGTVVADNDTVAEVCYESGNHCPGGDTCHAGGICGIDNGTPCGGTGEWFSWYPDATEDTLTWYYWVDSYVDWYHPTQMLAFTTNVNSCSPTNGIPNNGSLQCDQAWVEMLAGKSCPD